MTNKPPYYGYDDWAFVDLCAEAERLRKENNECLRWIPVEEQRPQYRNDVLILTDKGKRGIAWWSPTGIGQWNIHYIEETGLPTTLEGNIQTITHWMELPKHVQQYGEG